jgi:hypothetical protein
MASILSSLGIDPTAGPLLFWSFAACAGFLVFYGLLGPKKLRDKMKAIDRELYYKSQPILPVDPHQSLDKAFEHQDDLPPFKERMKRWLIIQGVYFIVAIVVVGILFFLALTGHIQSAASNSAVPNL